MLLGRGRGLAPGRGPRVPTVLTQRLGAVVRAWGGASHGIYPLIPLPQARLGCTGSWGLMLAVMEGGHGSGTCGAPVTPNPPAMSSPGAGGLR